MKLPLFCHREIETADEKKKVDDEILNEYIKICLMDFKFHTFVERVETKLHDLIKSELNTSNL